MNRSAVCLLIATLALPACGGRFSDSGWNPLGWFSGGSRSARSLTPEGGYQPADARPGIPAITSARWEPLNEGRLLVVTGMAPSKGYWDAELVTESAAPTGRISPDPDGTLRLRFVARPPVPGSTASRMPASETADSISAAMTLSASQLSRISRVQISGAGNVVTIPR